MIGIKQFLKDWTLPVAIATGTVVYLIFYLVPQLEPASNFFGPIIDTIFPMMVFCTLFSTFCRVDFHQMRPHRWQFGVLLAQVLLVALNVWIIFSVEGDLWQKILWESVLTCIIGPAATAAPVVTAKIGGNINTMTAFVVLSSFASALMIPAVFPLLERGAGLNFWSAFLIILEKLAIVLIAPLALGWFMQHYAKRMCKKIVSIPDLSFYLWAAQLSVTSGVTVRNIVHSEAGLSLLLMIAILSLILCFVLFLVGRRRSIPVRPPSRRTPPSPSGSPILISTRCRPSVPAAMSSGRTSSTLLSCGSIERNILKANLTPFVFSVI